ncbi:MAG: hypothetical protein WBJ24_04245, partial [Methanosarcina flavescens]
YLDFERLYYLDFERLYYLDFERLYYLDFERLYYLDFERLYYLDFEMFYYLKPGNLFCPDYFSLVSVNPKPGIFLFSAAWIPWLLV